MLQRVQGSFYLVFFIAVPLRGSSVRCQCPVTKCLFSDVTFRLSKAMLTPLASLIDLP